MENAILATARSKKDLFAAPLPPDSAVKLASYRHQDAPLALLLLYQKSANFYFYLSFIFGGVNLAGFE